jgi:hypothetical protein
LDPGLRTAQAKPFSDYIGNEYAVFRTRQIWLHFFSKRLPRVGSKPWPLDFIYFPIITTLPLSHSGSPNMARLAGSIRHENKTKHFLASGYSKHQKVVS